MKYFLCILLSAMIFFQACKKNHAKPEASLPCTMTISTPGGEQGYLYIDGEYTGKSAPGTVNIPAGNHTIGVALKTSFVYLKKEMAVSANTAIDFSIADKPSPKIWKALWIGLNETKGTTATGECSTHFSTVELDTAYDFFKWSLKEHFEKYSYNTMKWETERRDITTPVVLTKGSIGYTVEPPSITTLVPQIQPGAYDCVFVFWREREGDCSFPGNYFGLAWTNPMVESSKTGYVTIKFDAGLDITGKINNYKANDPGVWVHEWLHTVGENFYQSKGLSLPQKAGGFSVHAAEVYRYNFPWMNWYLDFISGRVLNTTGDPLYLGIGPEAFLKCTVRETAINGNCN